jgi:hypothetical protein
MLTAQRLQPLTPDRELTLAGTKRSLGTAIKSAVKVRLGFACAPHAKCACEASALR